MWIIQALRTVFHENLREEVFQMSFSWLLDVFWGLSGLNLQLKETRKAGLLQFRSLLEIFRLNK